MKKCFICSVSAVFALQFLLMSTGCAADGSKSLTTQKDKVSYSIGWEIGNNFKKQSIALNADAFVMGMKNALAGSPSALKDTEMQEVMTTFQKEIQEKQMKSRSEGSAKNKKEGEEFLAKNKTKPGVKTTMSGLQYKVITQGTGPKPKATDTVTVNYRGTLINGTEFDSSYKRNQPATFPVNGVIRGWTEALQLMKTGSKYELYIPSNLAYGEQGAGGDIGPDATLIFTVELISIK
jgi:FKBP-type peptidyl-prolyl cis-trans isomerase FklB